MKKKGCKLRKRVELLPVPGVKPEAKLATSPTSITWDDGIPDRESNRRV